MSAPAPCEFRRIEARSYDHHHSDKKKPTAYEVVVNDKVIGVVRSKSEETWQTHDRIRYRMRGFHRYWTAHTVRDPHRTVGYQFYTRNDAARALLDLTETEA